MNENSQILQVVKLFENILWEIPKPIRIQIPKKEAKRVSKIRLISK